MAMIAMRRDRVTNLPKTDDNNSAFETLFSNL
jgi:hypothetical protein